MFCRNEFWFRQNSIMICKNEFWFRQNRMMICRNGFWFERKGRWRVVARDRSHHPATIRDASRVYRASRKSAWTTRNSLALANPSTETSLIELRSYSALAITANGRS